MLRWMTLYMQLLRWAEVRISIVLSYVSFFFNLWLSIGKQLNHDCLAHIILIESWVYLVLL
jgi:hypothetical protein